MSRTLNTASKEILEGCRAADELFWFFERSQEEAKRSDFDWADFVDGVDWERECGCGSTNCRAKVTGRDWKILALQRRYAGRFSDYLARKIRNQNN